MNKKNIYSQSSSNNKPESLFHYTSASGLLGIIESGKIRTTKIHYLNDKSELLLAFDYIRNEIEQQKNGIGKTRTDDDLNNMIAALDFNASTNLCVASFTEMNDQLSQWRGYCEIGKGYSLGFSFDKLDKLVTRQSGWELVPCVYSEKQHKALAKDLVDEYPTKEMLKSSQDRLSVQPNSQPAFIDSFASKAMSLAPRIKSGTFKEEKEWRLITPLLDYLNAKFREGSYSLIPYWEFDLDLIHTLTSITIGPTSEPKLAYDAIQGLLIKKNHYKLSHIKIVQSKIPYRKI